ncbi:MAG TPA: Holliday junction resolvase Hjc [Candidatus Acidoferrum sp.]|nr:Holliday junction resolvase Hjc [Candidatus Acidoferrum sp.]
MTRYSKGARCERELLTILHDRGYSVVRSAGSGVNSISPDLVAVRKGRGLAFECKAWESTSISIDPDKYRSLVEWEQNSEMQTFIAWRMNGQGWFFVGLGELFRAEKNYTITMKDAKRINRKIDEIMK